MTSRIRASARPVRDVIEALVTSPYPAALGDLLDEAPTGRKRLHPPGTPFIYGALVRHFRSASRLDNELKAGLWNLIRSRTQANGRPDPGPEPFTYHHFAHWRDLLAGDTDLREALANRFTRLAVGHARNTGLLTTSGGGSVTHPHPSRTIYGDGTVVRPIYRQPRGEETGKRVDPSAEIHTRHDGHIYGNNFVWFATRNPEPHGRIVLAIDRVPAPGQEANTAVELAETIHDIAGPGLQAVVYDGAFQGVHIDRLMRNTGLLVVNRLAAAVVADDGTITPKQRAYVTVTHQIRRNRTCRHTLHIRNGTIVDVALADDGTPVIVGNAVRRQVKRIRRSDGTWRFNLAVTIPCANGDFEHWTSPHATDTEAWRPEHLRLLPPDDPTFQKLYGLRNDLEALNNTFKRSLLVNRATSVGWERQLIDMYSYAILHNSTSMSRREVALLTPNRAA
jgi:hypothetical protein